MTDTKRILWVSNAPFAPTGYGNQTGLIAAILPQYGHEMAVACNYGLAGKTIDVNGVTLYPAEGPGRAKDGGVKWANELFKPEVIISLYDPWAFRWPYDEGIEAPWVAWTPVDTEPASKETVKLLREKAAGVVAYSKFGQRVFKQHHEIEAEFIPHGVVTNTFTPGDPAEGRKVMQIPENVFLVSMIANNQGLPSRKSIYESLIAFHRFNRRHPDSAIYLHMFTGENRFGVDISSVTSQLGFPPNTIYSVPQHTYGTGSFSTEHMVMIYRSTDVLLNPSLGEGFGIPILEAQSCGTPVIANDCTAMTELVERAGGWLTKGQPFRHAHHADFSIPLISSIEQALEEAYLSWKTGRQWEERVMAARRLALSYDFQNVVAPMWHQYLIKEEWNK